VLKTGWLNGYEKERKGKRREGGLKGILMVF
jgi:hypothetical protein